MAIDKTIRIQDLPSSSFLESDNLIIINDSDNITRSITFNNFIANITEFPGGISFPPTSPGVPGISFCPDGNENCGTGIGSWRDCELFISSCGDTIVEINQGGVNINGDLGLSGSIEVNADSDFNGNVNIGNGCGTSVLEIDAQTNINCDANFKQNVSIGDPATQCLYELYVNAKSVFDCESQFKDDVTINGDIGIDGSANIGGNIGIGGNVDIDGKLTLNGDIELNGNLVPPTGGLNLTLGDLIVSGDAVIGKGCATTLQIDSKTFINCDTVIGDPNTNTSLDVYSDTTITGNLNVVSPGIISGNGSGITNLNIPDNLTFKGDIDITKSLIANNIQTLANGDFYLNVVTGTPHSDYGLSALTLNQNVFVYYTTATNPAKWAIGADINSEGLVTIVGNQIITGFKEFSKQTKFTSPNSDISDTNVANIPSVVFTGSATSASTKAIDPGITLVTKDYIDGITGGGGAADPLGTRFVEVAGDNMTGSLTIGPVDADNNPTNSKITLNSTAGSITAVGKVKASDYDLGSLVDVMSLLP